MSIKGNRIRRHLGDWTDPEPAQLERLMKLNSSNRIRIEWESFWMEDEHHRRFAPPEKPDDSDNAEN